MRTERRTLRQKHLQEKKALENHVRNLERLVRDQGNRLLELATIADELTAKASTSVLVKPSEKDVAAVTMGVGSKAALLALVIGAASTVSASDFDYDFNSRLQSMQEQRAILRGEDPADAVIRAQTNPFINPCK